MCVLKCVVFLCLSLAVLETSAGAVKFIEPCIYSDNECLMKSAQIAMPYIIKGVPEMGIPSFDPMTLNDVNGDNGELKLKFKNMIVNRIPECKIEKVERPEKLKLNVELICPITATGKYLLGGKLLFLDVEGDGDFEIKTEKIKFAASVLLKVIEKNGKKYYKFSSFDFKYDVIEKVYFTLHNLYNGDEAKAEPVNSVLDQSWKEIATEIGKPVIKEIITQVVHFIGKLFLHLSLDEIERN